MDARAKQELEEILVNNGVEPEWLEETMASIIDVFNSYRYRMRRFSEQRREIEAKIIQDERNNL